MEKMLMEGIVVFLVGAGLSLPFFMFGGSGTIKSIGIIGMLIGAYYIIKYYIKIKGKKG